MNKSFLLKVCHNTIGKECICVVAVLCQYFVLNGEPTKIEIMCYVICRDSLKRRKKFYSFLRKFF